MWACPKCGHSFKKVEQDHYCGKAPETTEEYILSQDEESQCPLRDPERAARCDREDFMVDAYLVAGTQYHSFCGK